MARHTGPAICTSPNASALKPLLCLLSAVILLSSITPVIKYVFQHSDIHPLGMAFFRVMIGFVFLLLITLFLDRRGLIALAATDAVALTVLGFLGVVSYAVAAWGLLYTSVTHYILIYSLIPSFTTMFSFLWGREQVGLLKLAGILISFLGCVVAVSDGVQDPRTRFGFGDGLVLLFTIMMAAHIVFSAGIGKRFGALTANTVMFGSSFLMLSLGAMGWDPPLEHFSPLIIYIGVATAAVFLLRYFSLQSLTPMMVGVYHNLVPLCTIFLAYLYLDEVVGGYTIIGGATIIAGVELVRRA